MKHLKSFNESYDAGVINDIMNIAKDDQDINFYKSPDRQLYSLRVHNTSADLENLVNTCKDIHRRLNNEDIEHSAIVVTNGGGDLQELEIDIDEYDYDKEIKEDPHHFIWEILFNIKN